MHEISATIQCECGDVAVVECQLISPVAGEVFSVPVQQPGGLITVPLGARSDLQPGEVVAVRVTISKGNSFVAKCVVPAEEKPDRLIGFGLSGQKIQEATDRRNPVYHLTASLTAEVHSAVASVRVQMISPFAGEESVVSITPTGNASLSLGDHPLQPGEEVIAVASMGGGSLQAAWRAPEEIPPEPEPDELLHLNVGGMADEDGGGIYRLTASVSAKVSSDSASVSCQIISPFAGPESSVYVSPASPGGSVSLGSHRLEPGESVIVIASIAGGNSLQASWTVPPEIEVPPKSRATPPPVEPPTPVPESEPEAGSITPHVSTPPPVIRPAPTVEPPPEPAGSEPPPETPSILIDFMHDELATYGLDPATIDGAIEMLRSGEVTSLRDALVKAGVSEEQAGYITLGINIAIGFIPGLNDAKDGFELLSGKDVVTGDEGFGVHAAGGAGLVLGSGGQIRALAAKLNAEEVLEQVIKTGGRLTSEFIEANLTHIIKIVNERGVLPGPVARVLKPKLGRFIHTFLEKKYKDILKAGGELYDGARVVGVEEVIKLGEKAGKNVVGKVDAMVIKDGKVWILDWTSMFQDKHWMKGWKKYVPNIKNWLKDKGPEWLRRNGIDPDRLDDVVVDYMEGYYRSLN